MQRPVPPESDPQRTPQSRSPASGLALAGAGLELAVTMIALTLAGWWADAEWGTKPWLTVIGALLGVVVGIYAFYRQAREVFDRSFSKPGAERKGHERKD